jgi:hypothetical protein
MKKTAWCWKTLFSTWDTWIFFNGSPILYTRHLGFWCFFIFIFFLAHQGLNFVINRVWIYALSELNDSSASRYPVWSGRYFTSVYMPMNAEAHRMKLLSFFMARFLFAFLIRMRSIQANSSMTCERIFSCISEVDLVWVTYWCSHIRACIIYSKPKSRSCSQSSYQKMVDFDKCDGMILVSSFISKVSIFIENKGRSPLGTPS